MCTFLSAKRFQRRGSHRRFWVEQFCTLEIQFSFHNLHLMSHSKLNNVVTRKGNGKEKIPHSFDKFFHRFPQIKDSTYPRWMHRMGWWNVIAQAP